MSKRLAFLLAFFLTSSYCLADELKNDLRPFAGMIINRIDIVRKNVFDDEMTSDPPFYYPLANSLHFVTRENVIRRELLFGLGDSLDIESVIETERNLRLSGFIGEVDISARADSVGGVDLLVTTTDLWTTKGEIFFDAAGGKYTVTLSATEANLLGWGKYIQVLGQAGNNQSGHEVYYYDGRLLGSRLGVDFLYSKLTFNRNLVLSLFRPQFSLSRPLTFNIAYSSARIRQRLFYKGDEILRYRTTQTVFTSEATYSFGRSERLGVTSGYNYEEYDFAPDFPDHPLNYVIPEDEKLSYPVLGPTAAVMKYATALFLDASGTTEDLTLGASLKAVGGYSGEALGANYVGLYQAVSAAFLTHPFKRMYLAGSDRYSWWRRDNRDERMRHRSEAALYFKTAETHLLVLRALTDFAWRQRSSYQVLLGGGNGLRGHSYFELAGSKLALGNLEYRFYTPIRILTVRLGAAAFFDIGNVWSQSEPVKFRELKSDFGVGLRFGLTKSSTSRVVSLDFARSLNEFEFFVSLGSQNIFGLKNFAIGE